LEGADAESHEANDPMTGSAGPHLSVKPSRLVLGSDLRETLLVGLSAVTALTRPVERWTAVTDQFCRLERGPASDRFRVFRRRVAAFFGSDADEDFPVALWRACQKARHRRRMQIVAWRVGKGCPPDIRLEGRGKLEAALGAGAGVILWLDNFQHHPLVGKYPFAEAGFDSWQLSSTDHGFSRSKFGHLFLNPIQHSVEARYAAGRIVFSGADALAATREIGRLLAQNRIVRITNNAYIGRRFVRVPIGVAAGLSIATTPLNLARSTGAALLPVSVIEEVPYRQYGVTIGAPIVVDGGDKTVALRKAAQDYARYLVPLIRAHPEQWITWSQAIDEASG
jgi:hypothetical protein